MKQPDEGQEQSGSVAETASGSGSDELELLRGECARLREQVKQLEKERDNYRRAVTAYVLAAVTVEDIQKGLEPEEGEPLEAFLPELEKMLQEHKP